MFIIYIHVKFNITNILSTTVRASIGLILLVKHFQKIRKEIVFYKSIIFQLISIK